MTTQLPKYFSKLQIKQITPKFREAVEKVSIPLELPQPGNVLVRTRYAGVNASDINQTGGRYDRNMALPADCGFEGMGKVVATGSEVRSLHIGQPVGFLKFGAFSEYVEISEKTAIPLPTLKPHYLPLLLSGLTAAISLDKVGEIRKNETVLVTAAAGGTGQFAVQLAKLAGCHVIGTCSSPDKVAFLKDLGCDRPINYKEEDFKTVLDKEYPKGVDVVYESIGGEMFDNCIKRLAVKGRLIVIGYISGYENTRGFVPSRITYIPQLLLPKSASVRGFFLFNYAKNYAEYIRKLIELVDNGKLKCHLDRGKTTDKGPFIGLDSAYDAVEYMYTQQSKGKVLIEFPDTIDAHL